MKFIHYLLSASIFIMLYSCSKPIDSIKDKGWKGNIIKIDDQRKLSPIALLINNGKAFIYSNAIFGSENDTLNFSQSDNDSTVVFGLADGSSMNIIIRYKKIGENESLLMIGEDFYAELKPTGNNSLNKDDFGFYKNIKVPKEAQFYLDGTYEGDIEMQSQLTSMMMGGIHLTYIFMDNFKVKQIVKNVMLDVFGGNKGPTIESYSVEDGRIFIGKREPNAKGFELKDNGKRLVAITDEAKIILKKVE